MVILLRTFFRTAPDGAVLFRFRYTGPHRAWLIPRRCPRMSAPCSSSSTARAKARSGSEYFPPSEKESVVTFIKPTTIFFSPRPGFSHGAFHIEAFSNMRVLT